MMNDRLIYSHLAHVPTGGSTIVVGSVDNDSHGGIMYTNMGPLGGLLNSVQQPYNSSSPSSAAIGTNATYSNMMNDRAMYGNLAHVPMGGSTIVVGSGDSGSRGGAIYSNIGPLLNSIPQQYNSSSPSSVPISNNETYSNMMNDRVIYSNLDQLPRGDSTIFIGSGDNALRGGVIYSNMGPLLNSVPQTYNSSSPSTAAINMFNDGVIYSNVAHVPTGGSTVVVGSGDNAQRGGVIYGNMGPFGGLLKSVQQPYNSNSPSSAAISNNVTYSNTMNNRVVYSNLAHVPMGGSTIAVDSGDNAYSNVGMMADTSADGRTQPADGGRIASASEKKDTNATADQPSRAKNTPCDMYNKQLTCTTTLSRLRTHNGEPHQCDRCAKQYTNREDLVMHLRMHNKNKPYEYKRILPKPSLHLHDHVETTHTRINERTHECHVCFKSFPVKYELTLHIMQSHTGKIVHKCNICETVFITKTRLEDHIIRIHTGEKPFICNVCYSGFIHNVNLPRHKCVPYRETREYTAGRPHQCEKCGKQYANPGDLVIHLRIHSHEKPFECCTCQKRFSSKPKLKQHFETHRKVKERTHECDVCFKCFLEKKQLRRHMRTHTGENCSKCNICNKEFITKYQLTLHLRIHTGEKPFVCDVCHAGFIAKVKLQTHKRIHTGEKPFTCNVCGKAFSQKNSVTIHRRTHTGEKPYTCLICDKRFVVKGQITLHIRRHTGEKPYKCNVCQNRYAGRNGLVAHTRTHTGERPYKCGTCDKRFKMRTHLTVHIRSHTGAKPYKCQICSNKFSHQGILKGHMRTHAHKK